jgi:hypothetical protein
MKAMTKSMTAQPQRSMLLCAIGLALATVFSSAQAQSGPNFPITPQQRSTAEQVAQAGVPLSELAANAPNQYTVKRGDTLWRISGLFLKSPWRWPELWGMNKQQIRNPHLIFPGQTLYLIKRDGRAMLSTEAPVGPDGTVRLSPRVRSELLDKDAIPAIPASVIEPFLSKPLIIEADGLNSAPRIIASSETGRVFMGRGDVGYVRGITDTGVTSYQLFRPAKPLKDPETGQILAYEAFYLGTGDITRPGDPATLTITSSKEEMGVGDRLLPAEKEVSVNYVPRAPEKDVVARVMSIYGGVDTAGNSFVVAINRGKADGLENGHVLQVWRTGATVEDKTTRASEGMAKFLGKGEMVKLPDEPTGQAYVFRTFDRVSYALIMGVSRPVTVGDTLKSPR